MINGYYNRHDPAENFDMHLFRAGKVLQSAELNEIQSRAHDRLRGVADALFNDGDIVRDAGIYIDVAAGLARLESGAVYLSGAVRGVAPAELSIPTTGDVVVGIYLKQEVVTELQDPNLRDPAVGVRNYREAGAARLRVTPVWGYAGDGQSGEFYPVHFVENGVARHREPPPHLDSLTQAIAAYDRDSSGGTYVVSGLSVALASTAAGDIQTFTVTEGRARVNGFALTFPASRRVVYDAAPDLRLIDSEPTAAVGSGPQRVTVGRQPLASIASVKITAQKTVTLTHGPYTGAADLLPDDAVLKIVSVSQGAANFVQGTDYRLSSGAVDWSLNGAEVATGTTYSVTYQYITQVAPTDVDDSGFTVTGAVPDSLILASYYAKMPRIDRLCLNENGDFVWVKGTPSFAGATSPSVGSGLLPLASINQTWREATRLVLADGVRMVSMGDLQEINRRIDSLTTEISRARLTSDVTARETGIRRGIFVDPLLDDSMRDPGLEQTAAIVNGELTLPIAATVGSVSSDVQGPTTCSFNQVHAIQQNGRTTTMKINPYMAFDPVPANVTLTPAVDRWTEVQTNWASPITERFHSWGWWGWGWTTVNVTNRLLASQTSNLEFLRQIDVAFSIKGFGPGETLARCVFDGIDVQTSA